MWRSNICSPIGVTGGCRLYSRAARAAPAISANPSIAASTAVFATSLTACPTRCAALMRSMLSLENVNDARKPDALLKPALPRVTRQRPAQITRDRGALMRGQFLAERQRFAAMTQHQTRHAVACVGFDFEPRPEPVELALRPNTTTNTLNDNSIAAYGHSLAVVCVTFDPAERPAKHAHLDHRVRQYRPGAEGGEDHRHPHGDCAKARKQRPPGARAQRIIAPRDRAERRTKRQ